MLRKKIKSMKRNILITALLSVLVNVSFGQIPNGDFSSWSLNNVGVLDPDGWQSSNATSSYVRIVQDTDRTGMTGYSLKVISDYDSTMGFNWGGELNLIHAPFTGSNRPTTIQGFYKMFNPYGGFNSISIAVRMYDASNTEIGFVNWEAPEPNVGTVSSWTQHVDTIAYTSNNPVTSYTLEIFLAQFNGSGAIYAHLDDLTFDGLTSIGDFSKSVPVKLLKESENIYLLKSEDESEIDVTVFSINGEKIDCVTRSEKGNARIDLAELQSGLYLCKVKSGYFEKSLKLVKNQ
jgi:hypothetical protein